MRRYAAAVIAFVSSVRPLERVASLQTRLLLAASLVLLAFLGLTGLSLERAFRNSTLAAIQERLQAQVYMLLGAAELDEAGRFTLPEELYAQVVGRNGKVLWRSPSLLGKVLPSWPAPLAPGKSRFVTAATAGTTPVFVLGYADRSLRFEVQVEPALVIHGDEGDFMEILGNLGDNACKWSRNRVILRAYQIFDSIGLATSFVDRYFTSAKSLVEGVSLKEIAEESARRHQAAYGEASIYRDALDVGGELAWRSCGEDHVWMPETIALLQH